MVEYDGGETLAWSLESIPIARDHLTAVLRRLLVADVFVAAPLLVSELMANAVLHTRSEVLQLDLWISGPLLGCSVRDDAPDDLPRLLTPAPTDPFGRGLAIVDAMAARWGCDVGERTKEVWFELDATD